MDKPIENISLKFSCDADWAGMNSVDGIKHCELCHKKVYDFTNAGQDEFLKILAENNQNICGRFAASQMAKDRITVLPAWKKWLTAAMVIIGINIFNNQAKAQHIIPAAKKLTPIKEPEFVLGFATPVGYDIQAEFPGGYSAFTKFLVKNIQFGKGMVNGKVFAQFDINKNGTLGNYKILRGLGTANDKEVIRVLKLSPKWKPAKLNGKPVLTSFTIPVSFQK